MFHVGRGEHVGALAAGDAVFQQARRAEGEHHAHTGFGALEGLRHLGQRGAQAACGIDAQLALALRVRHGACGGQHQGGEPPHATPAASGWTQADMNASLSSMRMPRAYASIHRTAI